MTDQLIRELQRGLLHLLLELLSASSARRVSTRPKRGPWWPNDEQELITKLRASDAYILTESHCTLSYARVALAGASSTMI